MQGTKDTHRLQQIMRRTLGGWIARQLHRKPMIVPVVADIARTSSKNPASKPLRLTQVTRHTSRSKPERQRLSEE